MTMITTTHPPVMGPSQPFLDTGRNEREIALESGLEKSPVCRPKEGG